jgi:hypothetical protein
MTCETTHYLACECREAKVQKLVRALEFYAIYSPRQHPEGFYEIHVAPGEGGEVRFGTLARKILEEWNS